MNIVKPRARMMSPVYINDDFRKEDGVALLQKVEWCARISHRSEDAATTDSWLRFIKAVVLEHGDWSVTEHASVTVDAVVDRGITHEWVRHRLFSFTQESTRFVNYEKKMPASFVRPALELDPIVASDAEFKWAATIATCEEAYRELTRLGVKPQIARSILPNALASRIVTTGNLRNWRHFFLMRTTREAHPQMREVAIPLLEEFKSKIPLLYDDIEPEARQVDNLRKPR